jgi:transcriptional regulator of acetoin/glycerol metabolism
MMNIRHFDSAVKHLTQKDCGATIRSMNTNVRKMNADLRKWAEGGRGRMSAVARECGVSRQAVFQWRFVPPYHVKRVSALTGIPQRKLRKPEA